MIVRALMQLVLSVVDLLTKGLDLPSLPDSVVGILDTAASYLSVGVAVLSNYTHLAYLLVLFGLCALVEFGLLAYKIAMWVLRKIPFLGIE